MYTGSFEFTTWHLLRKKKLACVGLFQAHLAELVKRVLLQTNTVSAVIHGRLTSVLQPLDVCLNKPFKDRMQDRWMTWMVKREKSLTPMGNVKAPSLTTVTFWVLEAWCGLPEEMVARFKKCGISNSIDGTEDDILWEEDTRQEQESEDDESEDEDLYDGQLTEVQWRSLFGKSDDKVVASLVTKFPGSQALCLSRHFQSFLSFFGI